MLSGCFSKDQVYLDGILRLLRHRRNIDFKMLTTLGKVSVADSNLSADMQAVVQDDRKQTCQPRLTAPGELSALWQVSYEDVDKLRHLAVFSRTRIPHFMQDQERYLQHLDHIVAVNELDDLALQHLLP